MSFFPPRQSLAHSRTPFDQGEGDRRKGRRRRRRRDLPEGGVECEEVLPDAPVSSEEGELVEAGGREAELVPLYHDGFSAESSLSEDAQQFPTLFAQGSLLTLVSSPDVEKTSTTTIFPNAEGRVRQDDSMPVSHQYPATRDNVTTLPPAVAALTMMRSDSISPAHPMPVPSALASKAEEAKERTIKERLLSLVERNWAFMIAMLVLTCFVLCIDDVMVLAAPKRTSSIEALEYFFLILKNVAFFMFLFEFIILSWATPSYRFSFFFWLDAVAIVSFFPDVLQLFTQFNLFEAMSGLAVARTGRAARASARAARLVRMVRVIKLSRYMQRQNEGEGTLVDRLEHELKHENAGPGDDSLSPALKIIQMTTTKVTAMVLFLFFVTSLMTIEQEWEPYALSGLVALETSFTFVGGVEAHVNTTYPGTSTFPEDMATSFEAAYNERGHVSLLRLEVNGMDLRGFDEEVDSMATIFLYEIKTAHSRATFLVMYYSRVQAAFAITLIVILICVLGAGNFMLSHDANKLIILSINKIIKVVRLIVTHESAERRPSRSTSAASGDSNPDDKDPLEALFSMNAAAESRAEKNFLAGERTRVLFATCEHLRLRVKALLRAAGKSDQPWFLNGITSKLDIVFTQPRTAPEESVVARASSVDLVLWMLSPRNRDPELSHLFLLTYRAFLSPLELMELVTIVYCAVPELQWDNLGLTSPELSSWRKTTQTPTRIKTIEFLTQWLQKCFFDFEERRGAQSLDASSTTAFVPVGEDEAASTTAAACFHRLIDSIIPSTESNPRLLNASVELGKFYDRRSQGLDDEWHYGLVASADPPPVPLPTEGTPTFENAELEELARQMALESFSQYSDISYEEVIDRTWQTRAERARNVSAVFQQFNKRGIWVQASILDCDQPKQRAYLIKRFIELCEYCLKFNNFNGVMEVYGGLTASSISRLKKTWRLVPKPSLSSFKRMRTLVSTAGNNKELRTAMSAALGQAGVPYLGLYLQDLVFLHEGNRVNESNQSKHTVNVEKCRVEARIITTMLSWKRFPYNFVSIPAYRACLSLGYKAWRLELEDVNENQNVEANLDKLYNVSLQREPRESG